MLFEVYAIDGSGRRVDGEITPGQFKNAGEALECVSNSWETFKKMGYFNKGYSIAIRTIQKRGN